MKPKLLLCLALVLSGGFASNADAVEFTNSPTLTNSEQNFQSLVKLIEQRQFDQAHKFYWQQKGIFSQEQRNAVFLLAAKMLIVTNDAKSHLDEVYQRDLILPDLVQADYFTILDGVTYRDHGITNSEAIPYLIAALADETNGVGPRNSQSTIGILWALTRRDITGKHPAVVDWWRNWWMENKNRHPVFDTDLEKILRNEILKLDGKIMLARPAPYFIWDSTTRFELENYGDLYSWNEWNGGPPNSVFTFEYGHAPGGGAKNGFYSPEMGDDVLYIRGEYLTKNLYTKDEPPQGEAYGKKFPMQEIYSETVDGTGIAIKIEIATTNKTLIDVLKKKLDEQ